MYFIILTTALVLHARGITNIETSKLAAEALRPLVGTLAYLLYTIGIIGVGFVAIPSLAGSAAYAFAETFSWKQGLNEPFRGAIPFYIVLIFSILLGVAMDFSISILLRRFSGRRLSTACWRRFCWSAFGSWCLIAS